MSGKTTIRIVNTNGSPVLTVKDGAYIRSVYSDGKKGNARQVKYIDKTHFMYGFRCFHIDEFAEIMEANDFSIEELRED